MAELRDCRPERLGVKCGVTDQPRFDPQELLEEKVTPDETRLKHVIHIGQIAGVATFKFRESLTVGIVMIEIDQTVASDEQASVSPVGQLGNEIRRTCQFDVYGKFILQQRNRFEKAGGFRVGFQIHIHRHRSPSVHERGRATGEIDSSGALDAVAHCGHQGFKFLALDGWTHLG